MGKRAGKRDVVLPCSGNRHRVRLARGLRFWATARCPVCRTPVDATRARRVLRWITNLRHPRTAKPLDRAVWWGTAGFLALAVVGILLTWGLGDRWWPATVLLFGPRWVLLLPLAGLAPLAILRDRPLLLPLTLAALGILGPVMGLRTGWRALFLDGDPSGAFEVVTFNARGGGDLLRTPPNLLMDWEADIVAIQECGPELASSLRQIPGWYVDARSSLCLLSRFEILEVAEMERESLEFAGGAGVVVTYGLKMDGDTVRLTNLHLETPRAGFELIRSGRLRAGILKTQEKSLLRGVELRQAHAWTDLFQGPHLVVGDFNTAPESRNFREAWGGWQNAFSKAGRGFGGTRLNGWIRVRIDHILANDDWRILEARVGEDVGSDHLPVMARVAPR